MATYGGIILSTREPLPIELSAQCVLGSSSCDKQIYVINELYMRVMAARNEITRIFLNTIHLGIWL